MENPNTPFEKKTERLDIRLSHTKKQAFAQACENQGDTPSNAVRRFITSYIRRERRDDIGAAVRFSSWKKTAAITACLGVLGFTGSAIWTNVTTKHQTEQAFAHYDANKNGLIDVGEIAENDTHLHRVLNIDGQDGISRQEFQIRGKMTWKFVDPNSFKILEDKKGLFKQRSVSVTSTIAADITEDGNSLDSIRLVQVNGEMVEIPVGTTVVDFMLSQNIFPEGKVLPVNRPQSMRSIIVKDKQIEAPDGISVAEFMESENIKAESTSLPAPLSPALRKKMLKFVTNVVTFDLADPEYMHLTIFVKQPSGLKRSVIDGYQRSVTWVEGRKTPEHVMGEGRDFAVLTEPVSDEG